jgi:hypothetical protein
MVCRTRREFLKDMGNLGLGAVAYAMLGSSPVSASEKQNGNNVLHSVPPIKPGTKYALFRSANYNDVLDGMDAVVGEYSTQQEAFNALKIAAVPNSSKNRRHYLVGNGKVLAVTHHYQSGWGGDDPFDFARKHNQPVFVHAMDIDGNGNIGSDQELTTTYFFLDQKFSIDTAPQKSLVVQIIPSGDLEKITSKGVREDISLNYHQG